MEQTQKLIQQLLDEIDSSVNSFNESIPDIQKQIFLKMQVLLKDLELSGDDIKNSVANIKSISTLKNDIENIILNKNYLNQVADFTQAFNTISTLNNKYFATLAADFKPAKVLEAIKTDAIDVTVTQLTEAGINANVTEGIQDLLRTSIRSGGKYTDLVDQMRNFILTDKNGIGALEQYTRTITNDSLNTYSATYSDTAASGLGLEWFLFTGSMLKTSRPMCLAMHEDKYFHISQIPELLKGNVNGKQTPLGKNDLPLGFKDETTVENYTQLRNGWNCGHQFAWVTNAMVPEGIRRKFKK